MTSRQKRGREDGRPSAALRLVLLRLDVVDAPDELRAVELFQARDLQLWPHQRRLNDVGFMPSWRQPNDLLTSFSH